MTVYDIYNWFEQKQQTGLKTTTTMLIHSLTGNGAYVKEIQWLPL